MYIVCVCIQYIYHIYLYSTLHAEKRRQCLTAENILLYPYADVYFSSWTPGSYARLIFQNTPVKITTPAPLHLPEHLREGSTSGHSADVLFVCLLTYTINLKRRSAKFEAERDGDGMVLVVPTWEGPRPLLTFPL